MRKLQLVLAKKEKAETFLSNLENLKKEETINEAQYKSLKNEYTKMLDQAVAEIESIKSGIRERIEACQEDINTENERLKTLEIRFKVGELSRERYERSKERTQKRIGKLQQKLKQLEKLLDARSSSDIGTPIDRSTEERAEALRRPIGFGLSLGEIFSESIEIYKNNPVIMVPSLLPVAWGVVATFLGIFGGALVLSAILISLPMEVYYYYPSVWSILSAIAAPLLGILASIIIYVILLTLSVGMTIELVKEASAGRRANLSNAWEATKERMTDLLAAAILVAIIAALLVFITVILLIGVSIAPALVFFALIGMALIFFLWFVPQAIMIQDASARASLVESFSFVKNNFSDSFIIIVASLVIYIALSAIPIVGVLLTIVAIPFIVSLSTLLYMDKA